jgi:hypothetical protein
MCARLSSARCLSAGFFVGLPWTRAAASRDQPATAMRKSEKIRAIAGLFARFFLFPLLLLARAFSFALSMTFPVFGVPEAL